MFVFGIIEKIIIFANKNKKNKVMAENVESTAENKIEEGSTVKHKTEGYIAKVKKLYNNGNGILTVIEAEGEFGKHIPFDIEANDIEKYFDIINTSEASEQPQPVAENINENLQAAIPSSEQAEKQAEQIEEQSEELEKTAENPINTPVDMAKGKTRVEIIKEIRALIDEKGLDINLYSDAELQYLRMYDGVGGLHKDFGVEETMTLDQFLTSYQVIQIMWGLAVKHGFTFSSRKSVLEPAIGTGRFLEYVPENFDVDAFDIDYYCYVISKLTFPKFNIQHKSFESIFFQGKRHVGLQYFVKRYDLVIGNPPYRKYESDYSGLENALGKTEKDITLAKTFDQYFIARGIDVLKPNGLLVYIIPNSFLSNDNQYNEFKEQLWKECELIDAYRLPSGIFSTTQVSADIIVLRKRGK